jgi:hypothetical protein
LSFVFTLAANLTNSNGEGQKTRKQKMPKITFFEFIAPEKWRFAHRAKVQLAVGRAKEFAEKHFQFENLERHIEEYLRQWVLRELIETYGYAENKIFIDEFLTTGKTAKIAPIIVKNAAGEIAALIRTGYFGDTELDFERACQDLQSDLDAVPTAHFAMVTDGKMLACLAKSDENIADYKTTEDFPTAADLDAFAATGKFPDLKITTQKIQKLPRAPKIEIESKTLAEAVPKQENLWQNQFKKNLSRIDFAVFRTRAKKIGLGACVALIAAFGLWATGIFSSKASPNLQSANLPTANRAAATEKLVSAPNLSPQPLPPRASNAPRGAKPHSQRAGNVGGSSQTLPDGSIKLSSEDAAIMQSRPVLRNPAPPAPKPETEKSNRIIIRQPYTN